jgi:putative (di)nucleoside polyphosphate hydrolase
MVINNKGYRLGVGIALANKDGRLFWGKRYGQKSAWQFPQGGILPYETLEETMYRELHEEVGLKSDDVEILGVTERWLHYKLPVNMRRYFQEPLCIGQKQKWFLLRLLTDDSQICLEQESPEFDLWKWVDYWYPVDNVVFFKRQIYNQALSELERFLER